MLFVGSNGRSPSSRADAPVALPPPAPSPPAFAMSINISSRGAQDTHVYGNHLLDGSAVNTSHSSLVNPSPKRSRPVLPPFSRRQSFIDVCLQRFS